MTNPFNANQYIERLEKAGVPSGQAAVHASALSDALGETVCAKDLQQMENNLRKEIHQVEGRLNERIDIVRTDINVRMEAQGITLNARIDKLDTTLHATFDAAKVTLNARIDKVETGIQEVRGELLVHRWALGIIAAFTMSNTAMLWRLFERLT
ncbi:MAG: hypothetical protein ABIT83_26040 [Massilia sp.]